MLEYDSVGVVVVVAVLLLVVSLLVESETCFCLYKARYTAHSMILGVLTSCP